MLSIAILDDNMDILNEYEKKVPIYLKRNNINGKIVIATTNHKEFIREIRSQSVNICIMDINLNSEVNGLYIANLIRKEGIQTEIIFCSGMLEFLPQAFDVRAYNFIPKPINGSLEKCLLKLDKEIQSRQISRNIVEVKFGSRTYFIPTESIMYFKAEGDKLLICSQARTIEINSSLGAFLKKLNSNKFMQCHKSTIINSDYLDFIDAKTKTISLTNGFICELGAKYLINFDSKRRGEVYAV